MNDKSYYIDQFKQAVSDNNTLKKHFRQNGLIAYRRFWNLFRTDLMRKRPDDVEAFLRQIDVDSKLVELPSGSNFGENMAKVFSDGLKVDENTAQEQRMRQEALIYVCMEMDASCRLERSNLSSTEKDLIKKRLELWRIPK